MDIKGSSWNQKCQYTPKNKGLKWVFLKLYHKSTILGSPKKLSMNRSEKNYVFISVKNILMVFRYFFLL